VIVFRLKVERFAVFVIHEPVWDGSLKLQNSYNWLSYLESLIFLSDLSFPVNSDELVLSDICVREYVMHVVIVNNL
jgi:hypothetical protein